MSDEGGGAGGTNLRGHKRKQAGDDAPDPGPREHSEWVTCERLREMYAPMYGERRFVEMLPCFPSKKEDGGVVRYMATYWR